MSLPVDSWPLPESVRGLLDRFLSDAINLTAGEYFMQQGRMTREQALRDMRLRIGALETASSEVRRALNALGEARMRQRRSRRHKQRAALKAKRGWA